MLSRRRQLAEAAGAVRRTTFMGLPLSLEFVPGEFREGVSSSGEHWQRKMYAAYGYIPGTDGMGADGDAVDVYLARSPVETDDVYCVNQYRPDGTFDEVKLMVGYPSEGAAEADYARHGPPGSEGWSYTVDRFSLSDILDRLGAHGLF